MRLHPGLAPEARRFATSLPGAADRAGRLAIVRQAVTVANAGGRAGPDPAHSLRGLAKAVDALNAMALAGHHTSTDPRRQRAC